MFLYFVFFLNFCLNFFFNFYLKFFFSKIFLLKLFCWNFFCWNLFLQNFFLNFLFGHFFFRPLGSSVQKCQSRGVPNDLTDVRSKNLTNAGSRMTFGMFGPKTLPTRGSERPFRSLDMVNLGKLIISVAVVRHVYKVTIIIWSGKTFF